MKRILAALVALATMAGCASTVRQTQPETQGETVPTLQSQPAAQVVPEQTVAPAPEQTVPAATQADRAPEGVVISEVMADNRTLVLGCEDDWIELHNTGEGRVSLAGCALALDPEGPGLALDGNSLGPGEYLTIRLEEDAPFQLSEQGQTVYLIWEGQILSRLTFGASEPGVSMEEKGPCAWPTPGYANTEEGYLAYLQEQALPELSISEVLPDNRSYAPVRGSCYSLVEVVNTGTEVLDLGEYDLSDRWAGKNRYTFPNVTLGPGERYVVYCSGTPELGQDHAPFSLRPGETVYLGHRGRWTDCMVLPGDLKADESYGRQGAVPMYLSRPTPGGENPAGWLTGVASPQPDVPAGLYETPVTVKLTGPGTIYYTTDGSRPTMKSEIYREPIYVDGVSTIRAFCVTEGRKSTISASTYVVGQEHTLPVVVISIPRNSLWSQRNGIFTYLERDFEHEAVITLFEGGQEQFCLPVGFRLHGNDSRFGAKKNFQLRFRGEYGAGKLRYRLFEELDIDEFDSLLLKGGSEDWANAMMRDELSTGMVTGTTALYTQARKPCVLYLGGKYYGVYYLRERFSDEYVAEHLDVSPESVDMAFSSAGYTQTGSVRDFSALKTYVQTHNMAKEEHFTHLTERIDLDSLLDWYICRIYTGDTDTANIRRFRSVEYDGKWRWMFFDLDWGFYYRKTPVTSILDNYNGDHTLIQAVLSSPIGRDAFLRRFAYLLDTCLNEDYVNRQIDSLASQIDGEMPRDRERWNVSYEGWLRQVEQLRSFCRDDVLHRRLLADLQGYFGLSGSQMKAYFGERYTNLFG